MFELTIALGDAAMLDTPDIARALRRVAKDLENGAFAGSVFDDNGNRVGSYSATEAGE
jgi:hypothetical protein